jgi:transposase
MRRLHLRGRENILKRLVMHSGAANLGLLMRQLFGKGTPRGLAGTLSAIISAVNASIHLWAAPAMLVRTLRDSNCSRHTDSNDYRRRMKTACFTTCC